MAGGHRTIFKDRIQVCETAAGVGQGGPASPQATLEQGCFEKVNGVIQIKSGSTLVFSGHGSTCLSI